MLAEVGVRVGVRVNVAVANLAFVGVRVGVDVAPEGKVAVRVGVRVVVDVDDRAVGVEVREDATVAVGVLEANMMTN